MVNDNNSEELPVLIIGAGATGLAIANGLKGSNIPAIVFERDASEGLRTGRDWAIACHWSAPILESLIGPEKWSRIQSIQVDPNAPTKDVDLCPVLNGGTGEVMNRLPFTQFYRFLRSRLRALLMEGLDIRYSKKLDNLRYSEDGKSVTAYFEDGTSVEGRLVIGADGGRSKVRNLLVGAEKASLKRLPLAATFLNGRFTRDQALFLRSYHPLAAPSVHPDSMFGLVCTLDASDADAPETWLFTYYISWKTTPEEQDAEAALMNVQDRLRQVKERGKVWNGPVRSAFDWTPDNHDMVYYGPLTNWDPSLKEHRWDNHAGRATLAGDAAHPMTYHRGQGLNHALDDAGHIVRLLANQSNRTLAAVIGEYEAEMKVRSGEEVRLSELNSLMVHDWSKVEQSPLFKSTLTKGVKVETVTNGEHEAAGANP